MLVMSRKRSEVVVLCEKDTMKLVGTVCLVDGRNEKARIGFHFGDNIRIFRTELTTLKGMSFEEIIHVPIGTKIVLLPSRDEQAQLAQ